MLLGLWLGAGIVTDIAVTQNFSTVDRFLQTPGSIATSIELNRLGRPAVREILRRNAAEENNFLFEAWERAEIAIGILLFLLILFGLLGTAGGFWNIIRATSMPMSGPPPR